VNVAIVNGTREINAIQFVWLRANAEMELRHAAQEWWSWLHSPDTRGTPDDDVEIHIKFVSSLAHTTGRLGRWPLVEVGTSIYDRLPERPTYDVALAGVGALDKGEHQLSGWADGQLYYELPNGTVHCLNDTLALLATVLKTCAEYYAPVIDGE